MKKDGWVMARNGMDEVTGRQSGLNGLASLELNGNIHSKDFQE